MLMNASLDVIILSRDLDGMLRECLKAFHRSAAFARVAACKVHVVDNASLHPVPETFSGLPLYELHRFDRHRGFASACNYAACRASADFLLFLNNDVLMDEGALHSMLETFASHPHLAVCGTRMIFPDASIQHAGVVFGAGEVGPYHQFRRKPTKQISRARESFQAVTGACLLVRRALFEKLSGFDERYPFGLEDIDFCLRVRQMGYAIRCRQDTDSLHFESMTPGRVELDVPSRALFMERWKGRYAIDG